MSSGRGDSKADAAEDWPRRRSQAGRHRPAVGGLAAVGARSARAEDGGVIVAVGDPTATRQFSDHSRVERGLRREPIRLPRGHAGKASHPHGHLKWLRSWRLTSAARNQPNASRGVIWGRNASSSAPARSPDARGCRPARPSAWCRPGSAHTGAPSPTPWQWATTHGAKSDRSGLPGGVSKLTVARWLQPIPWSPLIGSTPNASGGSASTASATPRPSPATPSGSRSRGASLASLPRCLGAGEAVAAQE